MARIERHVVSALALLVLVFVFGTTHGYAQNYSVLYDFGNRTGDPIWPSGSLAQGTDGALYGISTGGGAIGDGTVFKITPAGQLRTLYSFCSQANCADGAQPQGSLTLRPDGHFLGATSTGGTSSAGTIFDISETGTLTVLYSFTGGTGGAEPWPPISGPDGHFYGTTSVGGAPSGCGTIYKITGPGAGGFRLLHRFTKTDGCLPEAPLVLGTDGNFYGTTVSGGTSNEGVVFSVTPAGTVTVLHSFNSNDGFYPYDPLVQGSDGNFYGTTKTSSTGTFGPTVFRITPAGTFTVLYKLNFGSDGSFVHAGLVQATDGNFYGVATQGGSSNNCGGGCGTLFQITPAGIFSVLYSFDLTTGSDPTDAPVQHTSGTLYGGTFSGGTGTDQTCVSFVGSCGVLYSWAASLPAFVNLVPYVGKVGGSIGFLGQGFTSSSSVSFNGTPATATVVSGTYLKATVPSGATTGFVTATTSSGTLTSNKQFIVQP